LCFRELPRSIKGFRTSAEGQLGADYFEKSDISQKHGNLRSIEIILTDRIFGKNAGALLSSPPYHLNLSQHKIWPVGIVIEHRRDFWALMSAPLLEIAQFQEECVLRISRPH
jgi:hypothetical protein